MTNAVAWRGMGQGPAPDAEHHPRFSALILGQTDRLTPSTRKGSAMRACRRCGVACAVIAALRPTHRAPVSGGWPSARNRSRIDVPHRRTRLRLQPRHHVDGRHHHLPGPATARCRSRPPANMTATSPPSSMRSTPSPPDRGGRSQARKSSPISAPDTRALALYFSRAVVVVEGATVRLVPTEATTMIILAILASLAATGLLCWLLFTLAVFALPAFVGATLGAGARWSRSVTRRRSRST